MATGICYTWSGNKKKYEEDKVKGVKLFTWPTYTHYITAGHPSTVYVPIDNYTCVDMKTWPSYQKNPNFKSKTCAYYGMTLDPGNLSMLIREYGMHGINYNSWYSQYSYAYNSYGCSERSKYNINSFKTYFENRDIELFNSNSYNLVNFADYNMASPGFTKFGLMTLYGEDFSTRKFDNNNFRYYFACRLTARPEDINMIRVSGNFSSANFKIPDNNVIIGVKISRNSTTWYYAPLRATIKDQFNKDVYINEISDIDVFSYFTIISHNSLNYSYANDVNKNYHHYVVTGVDNSNYNKTKYAYTYFGGLNNISIFSMKQNKISCCEHKHIAKVNYNPLITSYIYHPNNSMVLTDMLVSGSDLILSFSYFNLRAEFAE